MRVLYVTSEASPLAKTGGLADVSAALPAALRNQGVDVQVLMPGYRQALDYAPSPWQVLQLGDPLGCGEVRLLKTFMPETSVPVWLVDCPSLYDRPGRLYQDEDGRDWSDNHLRFALLSHVAAGIASEPGGRWRPDILHLNDWHTGLAPLLMPPRGPKSPATVFTVHNLAYQGIFDFEHFDELALLHPDAGPSLEFYGRMSFLKAGIQSADAITTVSPAYAREILTPEYGCGLDEILRQRAMHLSGILNGVDYGIWDPTTDPHLVQNYSPQSLAGKRVCKRIIQEEFGLAQLPDVPLIAFMSRLTHQKMPDVVLEALPAMLEEGVQFALVAEGDAYYETAFRELATAFPGQVSIKIGYDEQMAHRLLAGADMLLHPSRFEPCGLVPIYALRYGTVPIVRKCGGMTDTITDGDNPLASHGETTGFSFDGASAEDLLSSVCRALSIYRQPVAWRRIMRAGMRKDFGWQRSAEAYMSLYASLSTASLVSDDDENTDAERIYA